MVETELLDESNINLGHESEGFNVYSDLKFLYQIGKICAESGKFLEEGILCLDDYINLLNFFNPTDQQQSGNPLEIKPTLSQKNNQLCKAIYLVGLIFFQIKDFQESERFLNQVKMDLLEMREIDKYNKCEQMLAKIFQEKFDIYSEDLMENYFYPEYETKRKYDDSLDFLM